MLLIVAVATKYPRKRRVRTRTIPLVDLFFGITKTQKRKIDISATPPCRGASTRNRIRAETNLEALMGPFKSRSKTSINSESATDLAIGAFIHPITAASLTTVKAESEAA
jgi:hypothetical protein